MEVSLVTVIGLYFLADGFAELIRFAFLGVVIHGLDGSVTLKSVWTNLSRFEIVRVIQSMVKLTIGTALVLGRGASVARFAKLVTGRRSGVHGRMSRNK